MDLYCGLGVEGGVMLARGKTARAEVGGGGGCPGCCCYCDLYSLAEWAYRDTLSCPPAPLRYSPAPPPPCPIHSTDLPTPPVEGVGVSALHPHLHIKPDVAAAFLLSLDLLRPHQQYHALHHALETHAFKHASHRRSSSFGTPGVKPGEGGGMKGEEATPSLLSSTSHPANLHMPHYQIDPSMRAPGGSLGGVESALRFPDMPLPPTPTPSPGPTPTLSPAPTSSAIPSWLPYTLYGPEPGGGSHNGEGGGGGTEGGGGGTDEEELGAFWDLLDNEIRPIKPLPSCPESQKIFSEHKEMARKYLVLQQEIFNLRKRKSVLENKLSQAEKLEQIGNQRYQDKIRELESKRENLRHTHSRLRQQLEQIRTRQEQQQKRQQQQDDGNGGDLDHHLPLAPP